MHSESANRVDPEIPTGLDFALSARIRAVVALGLGNIAVVEIDPAGKDAAIHWQAFNKQRGNVLNVPYEVITIVGGNERYVVTDKGVGNNALSVNGQVQTLARDQRLRITLGRGVSIVGGYRVDLFPGHWADSMKFYDCSFRCLNPFGDEAGGPK
jgi:hypothetical protein